jgi:hypothetical protein
MLHRIAFPVVSEWYQEAGDYALPVPFMQLSNAHPSQVAFM